MEKLTWEEFQDLSLEEQYEYEYNDMLPNFNFDDEGYFDEVAEGMVESFDERWKTKRVISQEEKLAFAKELLQKTIDKNTHNGYVYGSIEFWIGDKYEEEFPKKFETALHFNFDVYKDYDFRNIAKDVDTLEAYSGYLFYKCSEEYKKILKGCKNVDVDYLLRAFIEKKISENIKDRKFVVEDLTRFNRDNVKEFLELYKEHEKMSADDSEAAATAMLNKGTDDIFEKIGGTIESTKDDEEIRKEFGGLNPWIILDE